MFLSFGNLNQAQVYVVSDFTLRLRYYKHKMGYVCEISKFMNSTFPSSSGQQATGWLLTAAAAAAADNNKNCQLFLLREILGKLGNASGKMSHLERQLLLYVFNLEMRQLLHCDTVNVSCKLNYMRDDANWRPLKRPVRRSDSPSSLHHPSPPGTATLNFHLTKSPKSWKQAAAVANTTTVCPLATSSERPSQPGSNALYQRKISPFRSANCGGGKSW